MTTLAQQQDAGSFELPQDRESFYSFMSSLMEDPDVLDGVTKMVEKPNELADQIVTLSGLVESQFEIIESLNTRLVELEREVIRIRLGQ